MEEIHEGVCGNHIGGKALALKALRAGFYWPSMLSDAQGYVKRCDKCQKFAPSNGQAEAANKQILNALKKKLDEFKGKWAEMVPAVLWANRTTEKEATGESPFKLTFGAEAVLPVEVGLPTYRIKHQALERNDQALKRIWISCLR
ncbi:uncharacterized protein LOC130589952 [Beta vulgaris subsp. vulgaris]|uniref:uncharacterized protein LOC130589952 n=1 Tax=Beta vulgaris subsp. vulgaris TaxID=3555 RepID=UPI002548E579|nr:uncharacterized protein LOC130589952 [Beta vulgaris subsp. vulgaris]